MSESEKGTSKLLLTGVLICLALVVVGSGERGRAAQPAIAPQNGDSSKEQSSAAAPRDFAASSMKATGEEYVIGSGDTLSINVWKEPDLTRVLPVRPDGKISMPLIGEIEASGLTPVKLRNELTEKLKKYVSGPEVTVIVQEARAHTFNIVGEIAKPGSYDLAKPLTVLDAIAAAGGLQEFAKSKKIYVLRTMPDGTRQRLPFNYKSVIKGEDSSQNVQLQSGDTVVVP